MRLLMVSNLFPPQAIGGAEIVMLRHARQLAAEGMEVAILAGWLPGLAGEQGSMEEMDGLRVYRFPFRSWDQSEDFHIPNVELFFRQVVRIERPQLVHVHNLRGIGANLIDAAHALGLPVVVTLHDYWWHCLWATRLRPDGSICRRPHDCSTACMPSVALRGGSRVPVRLRRDKLLHLLDRAHRLVSPSTSLARAFEEAGACPGRLITLSNGINLSQTTAERVRSEDGRLRFAMASSLAAHKGLSTLLDAAAMLNDVSELRGRWHLSIAGDGGMRGQVEREISEGRFGDAVSYLGPLPHEAVLDLFADSHAVILASCWPENEPVVLMEGAACGAALIATDVGGNGEIVQPRVSGLIVPPGDAAALAEAMSSYVRVPALAALHGDANMARRSTLDQRHTLDKLEAIYHSALQDPKPRICPPMVICGGEPVAELSDVVTRLHQFEKPGRPLRIVWHDWASIEDWAEAAFFWDWGGDRAARERAVLNGLPVLSPDGDAGEGIICYQTPTEAMAALIELPHHQGFIRLRQQGRYNEPRKVWRRSGPFPASASASASASDWDAFSAMIVSAAAELPPAG